MGFFGDLCSGIGSAISSACSAVGSFVSGCVSAVSSAVGSVCKGAAEVCSTVMKGVEKVSDSLGAIGQIAFTLCNPALGAIMAVVSTVSKIIGVLTENDKPEELGEAIGKAEKKPEDFGSTGEYIDYLRDEIETGNIVLDENPSPENRIAYSAQGTALAMKAIDEKFGINTDVEFWGTMGKQFWQGKLDGDDITNIITKVSENNADMRDVANYINGNDMEGDFSKKEIAGFIESGLNASKPELSKEDISDKMNELLKEDFDDKEFANLEEEFKEAFGIDTKDLETKSDDIIDAEFEEALQKEELETDMNANNIEQKQ